MTTSPSFSLATGLLLQLGRRLLLRTLDALQLLLPVEVFLALDPLTLELGFLTLLIDLGLTDLLPQPYLCFLFLLGLDILVLLSSGSTLVLSCLLLGHSLRSRRLSLHLGLLWGHTILLDHLTALHPTNGLHTRLRVLKHLLLLSHLPTHLQHLLWDGRQVCSVTQVLLQVHIGEEAHPKTTHGGHEPGKLCQVRGIDVGGLKPRILIHLPPVELEQARDGIAVEGV